MHRTVFTVIFLLVICFVTNAQVAFSTKTSAQKIGKNDLLEVSYEAQQGSIENFDQPDFTGWRIAGGPNVSSSTIITNGKQTSSMSYQYVLQPAQTGRLNVPGAKVVINGKTYKSNAITVLVTNKSTEATSNTSGVTDPLQQLLDPGIPVPENVYEENDAVLLRPNEDIEAKTKQNLFAVAEVSKKTCYPGEAIKATYKLFSRANMEAHISKRPSFSGFSSIDLPVYSNAEYENETRNGKTYKVYTIRNVQLYPLLTGEQTLQPVEIDATIQYRKLPENTYSYDPLAGMQTVTYPFVVKSEAVKVTVLPFPEANKPANFEGVTGSFSLEASVNYKDLAKSEAGTLKVTINGSGNWVMVQQPKINWPLYVDVFEPVVSEKLDSQSVPLAGKRVYEFPFTTSKAGSFTIPPIKLSFFNADEQQYKTATTNPITVIIKNTTEPLHKTMVQYTKPDVTDGTEIFTGIVKIVFPLVALLLLGWFVFAFKKRQHRNRRAAIVKQENEQKKKTVNKQLYADLLQVHETRNETIAKPEIEPVEKIKAITFKHEAGAETQESIAFNGTEKEFFTSLKTQVYVLLKQHLNITTNTIQATGQALMQKGVNANDGEKIVSLLLLCEQHIYSPFSEPFDAAACNRIYAEVKSIITQKN